MRSLALLIALAVAAGACARHSGPRGDPRHGIEVVTSPEIIDFLAKAEIFYLRLTNRRVNTFATYGDRVLRDYFRSEQAYSDYYADFSQALTDAYFEQNRPISAAITEFVFDAPGSARVRVLWVGRNGRPLRPGTVRLEREDHWEQADGRWWVRPGKL